jgi:formylglycine-generating enzyme required for sulfatase activity
MCFRPVYRVSLQFVCLTASFASAARADQPAPQKKTAATFAGTKAGQRAYDNCLSTELVWIAPGKFLMGSPKSEIGPAEALHQVPVTLTQGYWLGRYEVTQLEWQTLMHTTPWQGKENVKEGDDYPVTFVSWDEAQKYCAKLTETERQAGRLPAGWKYMLPTEAQWEYACRAGTTTRFSFGNKVADLGDDAWFVDNAANGGAGNPHYVGKKKANPWGLSDMHGNVWEWCRDRFVKQLPGGTDPEVSVGASLRAMRGGAWSNSAGVCRSAHRDGHAPDFRDDDLGFRVAAVPSSK